jgi:hypothetical protein
MGIKLESSLGKVKNVPGPGNYDLMNRDNDKMRGGQRYGIGTSQRLPVVSRSISTVPGPGNYEKHLYDKANAPKFGFGSSTRNGVARKDTTKSPGPGGYEYKTFVGDEGRGNSMHAKLEYKPIEKVAGASPGPGAYESKLAHMKSEPRYGMGSGKRDFIGNKANLIVPGAGTHNPNSSFV